MSIEYLNKLVNQLSSSERKIVKITDVDMVFNYVLDTGEKERVTFRYSDLKNIDLTLTPEIHILKDKVEKEEVHLIMEYNDGTILQD